MTDPVTAALTAWQRTLYGPTPPVSQAQTGTGVMLTGYGPCQAPPPAPVPVPPTTPPPPVWTGWTLVYPPPFRLFL
jgi:hypothetical protein